MRLNKPLDVALIDIMSLEPIDSKFRPLRTNEVIWNKNKWIHYYGK